MENRVNITQPIECTVNGKSFIVPFQKMSYDMVCLEAYGKVMPGLTCTWHSKGKAGGILYSGKSVYIDDKTHFCIVSTSNA